MIASSFLIYGLVDPRTRLIRYVGLSSSGLRRPRAHRCPSCPDTYCRRWVITLQRLELDYAIVVLETVSNAIELADAERWWIAYGRACGWPLTNCTSGGGLGEEAIHEKQKRQALLEANDAARLRRFWTPQEIEATCHSLGIPREIERQCLDFFDVCAVRTDNSSEMMISAAVVTARITQETATQLYEKWLRLNPTSELTQEALDNRVSFKDICRRLFEQGRSVENTAAALGATFKTVFALHAEWSQTNYKHKKQAFAERCFKLFEQGKQPEKVAEELPAAIQLVEPAYQEWLRTNPLPRPQIHRFCLPKDPPQRVACVCGHHEPFENIDALEGAIQRLNEHIQKATTSP